MIQWNKSQSDTPGVLRRINSEW